MTESNDLDKQIRELLVNVELNKFDKDTKFHTVQKILECFDKEIDYEDLPKNIIVTNIPENVFSDSQIKKQFENIFDATLIRNIIYFPSFRRVRVDFDSPRYSTFYRIYLNEADFKGSIIKAFYIQDPIKISTEKFLKIPPPFKNFLISPPSSPPEGWEQTAESQPVINYDLISALAQLTPGQSHELHPESETTPKIVVHIAEESYDSDDQNAYENDELFTDVYSSEQGSSNNIKQSDRSREKKKKLCDALPPGAIHTPRPPFKPQNTPNL